MNFDVIKYANIFYKYCSANVTKTDVLNWINTNIPFVVQQYIILPKQLKDCSGVSAKIAAMARHDGLEAFTEDYGNHVVAIITCKEGFFIIDATYLQFDFICGGSLNEININEDPEEYKRMKDLFSKLEKNPMDAVKISFEEGGKYIPQKEQYDFDYIYSNEIERRRKLLKYLEQKNMTIEEYEKYLNTLK